MEAKIENCETEIADIRYGSLTESIAVDFRAKLRSQGYLAVIDANQNIARNVFLLVKAGFGDSVEISAKLDAKDGFIFYIYSHMSHLQAQKPALILERINKQHDNFSVAESHRKRRGKNTTSEYGLVCYLKPKPRVPVALYAEKSDALAACFGGIAAELERIDAGIDVQTPMCSHRRITADVDERVSIEDVERLEQECERLEPMLKGSFNLFDVLGVSRTEIRHSNMLAWLLDPNESHATGGLLLRLVISLVGDEEIPSDAERSFTVYREDEHIDMLLVSHTLKRVIAIENKIGAKEGVRCTRTYNNEESQLSTYENILEKLYPDYAKTLIFLTPDGELPSREVWVPLSYRQIVEKIEEVYNSKLRDCNDARKNLVKDYIETIRRNVLMEVDAGVLEKCREVYNAHRAVLRKILEYGKTNVGDAINGLLSQFSEQQGSPVRRRGRNACFGLSYLDDLFKDCPDVHSWWGTKPYTCSVQVDVENSRVCCNVAVWLEVPENQRNVVVQLNKGRPIGEWRRSKWLAWNSSGDVNKKNWRHYVEEGSEGDTLAEAVEKAVKDVIRWAENIR